MTAPHAGDIAAKDDQTTGAVSYATLLLEHSRVAAVWGIGYIGFSTMVHLASEGVKTIGYDPDVRRVVSVQLGTYPVPGLESWLGIALDQLVANGRLCATNSEADLHASDILVHFVAVPTERSGHPWWEPLESVLNSLVAIAANSTTPPLVIIESTLAPGTTDRLILPMLARHGLTAGKDILISIAPRRDWFVDAKRTLRTLDRIYSATDDRSAAEARPVLAILCANLHLASSHSVGEMVKCVENAYRHMDITLANQLSIAYPHVDIREVLELAATKWNVGLYRPSFGTGGYCIPLAGRYVIEGATNPAALSLMKEAFASDLEMRHRVADAVLGRGCRRIGILGLCYRGDLKVSVMSPSFIIAEHLKARGATVRIHDPYYSAAELRQEINLETFDPVTDIEAFDALIVTADHQRYQDDDIRTAVLARADRLVVLDNFGGWSGWPWPATASYFRAGCKGWLGQQEASHPPTPTTSVDARLTFDRQYLDRSIEDSQQHYFPFVAACAEEILVRSPAAHVLEIGAANGAFVHFLLNQHPGLLVTGVDLSPELVNCAHHNVPGATFVCGDIMNRRRLPSTTFDVVFLNTVHSLFDDHETWIDNVLSLLEPDGRAFVFGLFNPDDVDVRIQARLSGNSGAWLPGWNIVSQRTVAAHIRSRGGEASFRRYDMPHDIERRRENPLRSWTRLCHDGSRVLVNELQVLHPYYMLEMSKPL